jgi:hypothetical protein
MVEVIKALVADHSAYGGGAPLVHIHHIERSVFGNSIAVKVFGEIKIAAGERVWAKELGLKTIEVLDLTPEIPSRQAHGLMANKYIYHKGEYGNYASIDIFDDAGTLKTAGAGPFNGSCWLDFIAVGE